MTKKYSRKDITIKKRLKRTIVAMLCMVTMLASSISVSAAEVEENDACSSNMSARQLVCCNNMDKTTGYYEYHSIQEDNYPMCTITRMKVTRCRNCYVLFENTKIGAYEHEHPEIF